MYSMAGVLHDSKILCKITSEAQNSCKCFDPDRYSDNACSVRRKKDALYGSVMPVTSDAVSLMYGCSFLYDLEKERAGYAKTV